MRFEPILHIDLAAIQANFAVMRTLVGPDVTVSAVIKSDAYGLGLERIGDALSDAGCQSFFVANGEEGMQLRRRLTQADIFILEGPHGDSIETYRENRMMPVCNTLPQATAAASAVGYAVNLETGFGRLGLRFDELRSLLHAQLPAPVLAMSHLACADDPENPRNELQRHRFVGMCAMLGPTTARSLAASAGVSLGARYHFDGVRTGSGLFGLNNAGLEPNPFVPVIRLSAPLIDVRTIQSGESVGYMGTFVADRRTRLGILPIGYRHGLAWQVANRLAAEIEGYRAPLVGRVSMEYCAIDLTNIPVHVCQVGTWVDFIGPAAPLEALARSAATIPQEILVRMGASCTHLYHPTFGKNP
jgi:alanine racemase